MVLKSLLGLLRPQKADPVAAFVETALGHLHKKRAFTITAAPDPMTRVISFGTGTGEMTLHLDSLWRTWQQPMSQTERQSQLDIWSGSCVEALGAEPASPDQLMPLVRHFTQADWDEAMLEQAKASRPHPPPGHDGLWAVAFTGDLVVMLGLDQPNSLTLVDMDKLQEVGVPPAQALERALSNLDRLLPDPTINRLDNGLFTITFPQHLWAIPSALVMNGMLDDIMTQHGIKTAFMALPARSALLFCDAEKAGTLDLIMKGVQQYRSLDHPMSDFVFRMDVGVLGFVPLIRVPDGTP